ncbi:MAG: site-2 protease family protein [Candidatus Aenigmatarchaeota archaeon]
MVDLYMLSVIIFFAILGIIIYKDRKNIDFKYILFMRRTKKFTNLIDRIARISPSFWKAVGSIAVLVCFVAMAYGMYAIVQTAYLVYSGVITQPGLQLALPIPSSQMAVGPGYIGIPFWFWIITIAIILIPHEAFHGIIARAHKIRLKNVGLLLLAIFPGAFVEPDEKQVKKSNLITKLRIFAAGSFINITIGISIIFLAQTLLWTPQINGLIITNVNQTSPAGYAGLKEGMVIESINGTSLNIGFFDYAILTLNIPGSNSENVTNVMSSLILYKTLSKYEPGQTIDLKTSEGNYDIVLASHPQFEGFPYIGIGSKLNAKDPSMFLAVFPLLGMMAALSIFVAIFNILPIYPLDGGLMFQAVCERYAKKKSKSIVKAMMYIILAILLYGLIGPYLTEAAKLVASLFAI